MTTQIQPSNAIPMSSPIASNKWSNMVNTTKNMAVTAGKIALTISPLVTYFAISNLIYSRGSGLSFMNSAGLHVLSTTMALPIAVANAVGLIYLIKTPKAEKKPEIDSPVMKIFKKKF